jgi:DNA mismatch endonuclease (patch repair protein)
MKGGKTKRPPLIRKTKKAKTDPRRSAIMRAVKSSGTSPERIVAGLLRACKIRMRRNVRDLPGSPDFASRMQRFAIFVHGCFWHGHTCKRGARVPKTNADYWVAKIARNKSRDRRAKRELAAKGWRTMVIWECQMKPLSKLETRLCRHIEKAGASPPRPNRR